MRAASKRELLKVIWTDGKDTLARLFCLVYVWNCDGGTVKQKGDCGMIGLKEAKRNSQVG